MSNYPNMSYCQWQNTKLAMEQCLQDLEQRIEGTAEDELSRDEFEAAVECALLAQRLMGAITDHDHSSRDIDELEPDDFRTVLAELESDSQRHNDAA